MGVKKLVEAQKDKSTALLLAIFFGFWTYLYTYKIDKMKFWLTIGLALPTLSISIFVFWIIAIVQTVNRSQIFYVNYDLSENNTVRGLLNIFLTDDDVENIKIREIFSRIYKYKSMGKIIFSQLAIYTIIGGIIGFLFIGGVLSLSDAARFRGYSNDGFIKAAKLQKLTVYDYKVVKKWDGRWYEWFAELENGESVEIIDPNVSSIKEQKEWEQWEGENFQKNAKFSNFLASLLFLSFFSSVYFVKKYWLKLYFFPKKRDEQFKMLYFTLDELKGINPKVYSKFDSKDELFKLL